MDAIHMLISGWVLNCRTLLCYVGFSFLKQGITQSALLVQIR